MDGKFEDVMSVVRLASFLSVVMFACTIFANSADAKKATEQWRVRGHFDTTEIFPTYVVCADIPKIEDLDYLLRQMEKLGLESVAMRSEHRQTHLRVECSWPAFPTICTFDYKYPEAKYQKRVQGRFEHSYSGNQVCVKTNIFYFGVPKGTPEK